jgi:thiol-disulfide isomerase/thioredoxin
MHAAAHTFVGICGLLVAPPLCRAEVATLPDVPVSSQSGDRLNLRGWRGRIVIVNFWATWCRVCREELSVLQELADRRPDVKVLGVALDAQGWARVTPFVRQHNIRFPVTLGNRALLKGFEIREPRPVVPQVYLFDREGALVARWKEAPDHRELMRAIEAIP